MAANQSKGKKEKKNWHTDDIVDVMRRHHHAITLSTRARLSGAAQTGGVIGFVELKRVEMPS